MASNFLHEQRIRGTPSVALRSRVTPLPLGQREITFDAFSYREGASPCPPTTLIRPCSKRNYRSGPARQRPNSGPRYRVPRSPRGRHRTGSPIPPDLRQAVRASSTRLLHAQAALAHSLQGLKQITEFAEPLLQGRLAHHGIQALRSTELLRVERTWHWGGMRYLYRHQRHNLLQAALQNFADDEAFTAESAIALSGNIQVTAVEVQGSVTLGMQVPVAHFPLKSERYRVERLPLAPSAFATLCRELDLGVRTRPTLNNTSPGPPPERWPSRCRKTACAWPPTLPTCGTWSTAARVIRSSNCCRVAR